MRLKQYINESDKLPKGAETFYHTSEVDKAQGWGGTEHAYISAKKYFKNTKPFDRDYNPEDDEFLVFWYVKGAVAGGRPGWSFQGPYTKRFFKKSFGFNPKG